MRDSNVHSLNCSIVINTWLRASIKNRRGNLWTVIVSHRSRESMLIYIYNIFWNLGYIGCNRWYAHWKISNFEVKAVEGVHPGSDRTSRSVARNQDPRHKSYFLVWGSLSVAYTNTDLKPLDNNLQRIEHQFSREIRYKVFWTNWSK